MRQKLHDQSCSFGIVFPNTFYLDRYYAMKEGELDSLLHYREKSTSSTFSKVYSNPLSTATSRCAAITPVLQQFTITQVSNQFSGFQQQLSKKIRMKCKILDLNFKGSCSIYTVKQKTILIKDEDWDQQLYKVTLELPSKN